MFAFISNFFDWLRSLFWSKELEITVVGLNHAGKTTFVNVIADGNCFYEDMIPTVGFNMRKITKGRVSIKVWDLGGQKRFRAMWERYCRGVDVILFVVDAANSERLDEAKNELYDLLKKQQLASIPLLVLGNKKDLPEAVNEKVLAERLKLGAIGDREVSCYSVSCKEKTNLDVVLKWMLAHSKY